MVLPPGETPIRHRAFAEIAEELRNGDLLVLNDTRVLPAKLALRRQTGGAVEGLYLAPTAEGAWSVLLNSSRRLKAGETLLTRDPGRSMRLLEHHGGGRWTARLEPAESPEHALPAIGETPLPPYIHREGAAADLRRADVDRYQTVYAFRAGAVAAPTAGLHFTRELLGALRLQGVRSATVTLHVGAGTFQPITCEDLADHVMHEERYELPEATAEAVRRTRADGGRVIAVGTTSLRVLETRAADDGLVSPGSGTTGLFIYPPYTFRVVNVLLTNFHLPDSTLLALVYAFGGVDRVRRAYDAAIREGYRFYSFGDAMLIHPER
jgi:S-adenosylmethionine:tRNA ribosyltransferase-isomerase